MDPCITTIRGLVDTALVTTGNDGPRLALRKPHRGIDLIGIPWSEFEVNGTGLIRYKQHLLPRITTVNRPIHATLGVCRKRVANCRNVNNVRILWMNKYGPRVSGVLKTNVIPCASGIRRFVNTFADNHITAQAIRTGGNVDYIRIRLSHRN